MQTLIRDTLDVWREAERTLERMPPSSPDHETVALVALELREAYQRLTDSSDASHEIVERSRAMVDEAHALLRRIHGPADSATGPGTEAMSPARAGEAT